MSYNNFLFKGIFDLFKKYRYRLFKGYLNVNIFAVRNPNRRSNKFDDHIYIFYQDKRSNWILRSYPVTTCPGYTSLTNPINPKGTAVLVPGQYRGSHKLGKHRGRYLALVQKRKVKVYRDNNLDGKCDYDQNTIEEGYFGINIHKAGGDSLVVNNWSAGCIVFKKAHHFYDFLNICKQSAKIYGNSFTFTLFQG